MAKNSKLVEQLKKLLADNYVLYLKTQNFHWNVRGAQFFALHALFEQQYTDLAAAIDEIAERIRALGEYAPGSFKAFSALASIKEAKDAPIGATEMVKVLHDDQVHLVKSLKKAVATAAEEGDEVTAGLLTDRLATHEKNVWMLASSL